MKYCGVDFSLNSTGICIFDDLTNQHTYFNLTRKVVKKNIPLIENIGVNLVIHPNIQVDRTSENTKLLDAILTTDIIINLIKDCDKIGIEGVSFSSKGNSIAEISGYHYLLRAELHKLNIPFEVYPPKQIKKFAGNGNADKDKMFEFFKNEDTQLANVINDLCIKLIKPMDDIIDAYFICKFLKQPNLA